MDITKDYIPVSPVQHYFMGYTNRPDGTNIKCLHACGEAAIQEFTGLIGWRNSLLEGLVFGRRSGDINTSIKDIAEEVNVSNVSRASGKL